MTQVSIELEFADGRYLFHLGLAQVDELQAKCGVGIGGLYSRVMKGRYALDGASIGLTDESQFRREDLTEIVRQGLIGGGKGEVDGSPVEVTPIVANRLVQTYVADRPFKEAWHIAAAVLMARIEGYSPKKAEPAETPAAETTDGSTSREPSPTAP